MLSSWAADAMNTFNLRSQLKIKFVDKEILHSLWFLVSFHRHPLLILQNGDCSSYFDFPGRQSSEDVC